MTTLQRNHKNYKTFKCPLALMYFERLKRNEFKVLSCSVTFIFIVSFAFIYFYVDDNTFIILTAVIALYGAIITSIWNSNLSRATVSRERLWEVKKEKYETIISNLYLIRCFALALEEHINLEEEDKVRFEKTCVLRFIEMKMLEATQNEVFIPLLFEKIKQKSNGILNELHFIEIYPLYRGYERISKSTKELDKMIVDLLNGKIEIKNLNERLENIFKEMTLGIKEELENTRKDLTPYVEQ